MASILQPGASRPDRLDCLTSRPWCFPTSGCAAFHICSRAGACGCPGLFHMARRFTTRRYGHPAAVPGVQGAKLAVLQTVDTPLPLRTRRHTPVFHGQAHTGRACANTPRQYTPGHPAVTASSRKAPSPHAIGLPAPAAIDAFREKAPSTRQNGSGGDAGCTQARRRELRSTLWVILLTPSGVNLPAPAAHPWAQRWPVFAR